MKIKCSKFLKKILEVSLPICIAAGGLSGCSDYSKHESSITLKNDNSSFATWDDIKSEFWTIVKYSDGSYMLVKLIEYDNIDRRLERSYYQNVFGDYNVDLIVDYNSWDDLYWIETDKDVDSFINLHDYLTDHRSNKEYIKKTYSKKEIKSIYNTIIGKYDKKIDNKEKVLVKEKSLY